MYQLTPRTYPTFADLPVELAIRIVSFTIETNLKDAKRTYLSLVHVSSQIQEIAHAGCLPQFPIMLRTRDSLYSFHALLERHPNAGSVVRNLWVFPAFSSSEEQIGRAILLACQQLERLACGITLLDFLLQSPPPFRHDRLKDLTITSKTFTSKITFTELPHTFGPTLFSQLTHFRSTSWGYLYVLPFTFASLTHVSFTTHALYYSNHRTITFDPTQYPSLLHIVPTVPYVFCRSGNSHNTRRIGAQRWDIRVEMITCPKKWDESGIWEMAGRWGRPSIWERAASGNDICY